MFNLSNLMMFAVQFLVCQMQKIRHTCSMGTLHGDINDSECKENHTHAHPWLRMPICPRRVREFHLDGNTHLFEGS